MSEHTITELLSPAFLSRMQNMLGDEYESFLKSYEAPRTYGLRVNTAKISCDEFERIVPFPVTPIPWISNGYFYPEDVRPSFCPLYQAGLFYLQEPSAMTPASCLPVCTWRQSYCPWCNAEWKRTPGRQRHQCFQSQGTPSQH